jgi:hypothetical protein
MIRFTVCGVPEAIVSAFGLKLQVLFAGSPEHVRSTIPERPAIDVIVTESLT